MCIIIICCPFCDVINFKINHNFLIKPFFNITKNQDKNVNISRTKRVFNMKEKVKNCVEPESVLLIFAYLIKFCASDFFLVQKEILISLVFYNYFHCIEAVSCFLSKLNKIKWVKRYANLKNMYYSYGIFRWGKGFHAYTNGRILYSKQN